MTPQQDRSQSAGSREAFTGLWNDQTDIGRDPRRGGYARHGFDDAERQLREWFCEQARRRDLDVETDRNGNLFAWWGSAGPGAIVTGSHLDSVPGGGAFDGPLGVVSALLAVDELRARRITPRVPLAVVCFAEEEGGRFGLPCLGSRLLTGAVDADAARGLRDGEGVSLPDALHRAGIDPARLGADRQRLGQIATFIELHIEQGMILRRTDPMAAVGVASSIVAHGRWRLTLTGQGNHAGTTAVADRRDPMIPAAGAVLAARQLIGNHPGAVATIGRIQPNPGVTNVIASSVDVWLDVRHASWADTDALVQQIVNTVQRDAQAHGCELQVHRESKSDQVDFDPVLSRRLARRLQAPMVATGAGHDAGLLAAHVPSAMLFVRNPTGISHAPQEHAEIDDCLIGVQALADVLQDLLQ